MIQTYVADTYAACSLRCLAFAGPIIAGPYGLGNAQTDHMGLAAGELFLTGVVVGQDYHSGILKGQCNG